MIASITITLALGGAANVAVAHAPQATFERLAAAASIRRSAGPAEMPERLVQKELLNQLIAFVVRGHAHLTAGEWTGAEMLNIQEVTRDVVETWSGLAVLPEERLCWQRAGLDLAYVQFQMVGARVAAGTMPPRYLSQARTHFEHFRSGYNRTLAECTAAPR